ncbi:MAG: DUF1553 domain-containing protein, partial [Phycisphaeraceae bacterium]
LDCPDLSQLSPQRTESITAQQALSLLNNRFLARQYEHIAARIEREEEPGTKGQGKDDAVARQVSRLYQLALGRAPTDDELKAVSAYAAEHGMASAVRVIVNSNEFMFIP